VKAGDWLHSRSLNARVLVVRTDQAFGTTSVSAWDPAGQRLHVLPGADLVEGVESDRQDIVIAAAAAGRIVDALATGTLIAPTQSIVEPLPHQLRALSRCVSADPVRMLLADEVGLGKTIEAGLVITELLLRGAARRVLVVAPAGLVPQWHAELAMRFGETFVAMSSAEVGALAGRREDNFWAAYDRLIVPLDAVKPVEARAGWSDEQVERHNLARSVNLAAAGWDIAVIDEAHRVAGFDERVARHRLARLLADSVPSLLLLSATPHVGKTDGFRRVLSLLDERPFSGDAAITPGRVQPYVVRTSKRVAIDGDGRPLFQPRSTTKVRVEWLPGRPRQRRLYDDVTSYAREGYDIGRREKNNSLVFLMLLMQRLVSSSTRAIEVALERRLDSLLELEASVATRRGDMRLDDDFWEADPELQATRALAATIRHERQTVEGLVRLAGEARAEGNDAKLERLYDLVLQLAREDNDPLAKVLVFTEFVPTQEMLVAYLESMGIETAVLNGSMAVEDRLRAQEAFAGPARVLVSTEAGGEGLNLQVAHLVVNYDLPWNPMRIEQRIGRVDRIGQTRPVKAYNLVHADSVEERVHDLLELKLARILEEFGVDKLSDVLDSSAFEEAFQSAYGDAVRGLDVDEITSVVADLVERDGAVLRDWRDLLGGEMPDPAEARAMRDHPLPYWVERMTVSGIRASGGSAEPKLDGWHLQWPDGGTATVAFRRDAAGDGRRLATLGDPRIAGLLSSAISADWSGEPLVAQSPGDSIPPGLWTLWLVGAHLGSRVERRAVPLFIDDSGIVLATTARAIWDRLLEPATPLAGLPDGARTGPGLADARDLVESQAAAIYASLRGALLERVVRERARYEDFYERRLAMLERIGLPAVRRRRLEELEAERTRELGGLVIGEVAPELRCVAAVRFEA
jgi:superfamily II DNA or RNA helicase